jgi:hypothetical protein
MQIPPQWTPAPNPTAQNHEHAHPYFNNYSPENSN